MKEATYELRGTVTHWGSTSDEPFRGEPGAKEVVILLREPFSETDIEISVDYEEVYGDSFFSGLWGIRGEKELRLRCVLTLNPDEETE